MYESVIHICIPKHMTKNSNKPTLRSLKYNQVRFDVEEL